MNALKNAVWTYASRHANRDGLALTAVPGLRMMCVEEPAGDLHSVYRPLICFVLQGAKRMVVGNEERIFHEGQAAIISLDMPVVGRIVEATSDAPYLAVAVELQKSLLREITVQIEQPSPPRSAAIQTLFTEDPDAAILDCAVRLMRLLDRPEAMPFLHAGIMHELHYWLLSGKYGAKLRALADPDSYAGRLSAAITVLRANYCSRLSSEQLAAEAGMSLTAFHKHFKKMTSLTPGQYQKRLRLIEARRLMFDEGYSASNAAFEVGYGSVSQFTREYGRLFNMSPKQHVLNAQRPPSPVSATEGHAGQPFVRKAAQMSRSGFCQ